MRFLSAAQVEQYQRDGYLILEQFLPLDEVDALNRELDRVVTEKAALTADEGGFNLEKAGESPFSGDAKAAGVFRKIQSLCDISPPFMALAESDRVLDLTEDLLGGVYFHSNKLMFKPARHGSAKPWHQDYAYWLKGCPEPNQLSIWIALEPADRENGCVQLIPGSHKLGLLDHHKAELQVALDQVDTSQTVHAELPVGGAVIFHCLTLHYSPPNDSDRSRRAMILTYGATPDCGRPLRVRDEAAATGD